MRYLLLISCSQRKHEKPESCAAIDVYDGPLYRMLRKLRREQGIPKNLDVLIISAKYGLIYEQTHIDIYDQKMTPQRATHLRSGVKQKLSKWIETKRWITGTISGYDQVFINLGKVYMQTLEGFHWGFHLGFVSILEASGGIGQRVSQTKTWLARINQADKEI